MPSIEGACPVSSTATRSTSHGPTWTITPPSVDEVDRADWRKHASTLLTDNKKEGPAVIADPSLDVNMRTTSSYLVPLRRPTCCSLEYERIALTASCLMSAPSSRS